MKLTFPTKEEFLYTLKMDDQNMNTMQGEVRTDLPRLQICLKTDDNLLVGSLMMFNVDAINKKAEFGIHIYHPRGTLLAAKATRKFIGDMFEVLSINRIYARIHADNERSLDCAKRIGFEYEGTEKQSLFCCEKFKDVIVMGILRENFERKWKR